MNRRGFIASLFASPLLKWLPKRKWRLREAPMRHFVSREALEAVRRRMQDQHMAIAFDYDLDPEIEREILCGLQEGTGYFKIGDTIRVKLPVKYVV